MSQTVDSIYGVSGGLAIKAPVKVVATTDQTLSGLPTIGSTTLSAGDRVLLVGQADPKENGIYNVADSTWTRAADFDGQRDVTQGTVVTVYDISSGGSNFYKLTSPDPIIFGTSDITFEGLALSSIGNIQASFVSLSNNDQLYYDGGSSLWKNENIAATKARLGLTVGSDVQAYDDTLSALAGGLTAANKIPYATGVDVLGELDFKDEDDMASNSASAVASQQSIKSYVDSFSRPFIHVQEQQNNGVNGGSVSAGDNIRALNTLISNTISGASLSSNQITLPAGTYDVKAYSVGYDCYGLRARLYNVTDSANAILGSVKYVNANAVSSDVIGRITIAATKVFELRFYAGRAVANTGLGIALSDGQGNEIYSDVLIEKVN